MFWYYTYSPFTQLMQAEAWREHLRMHSCGLSKSQTQILKIIFLWSEFQALHLQKRYTAPAVLSIVCKASCNWVKLRSHIVWLQDTYNWSVNNYNGRYYTMEENQVFFIALKEKFLRDMYDFSFNVMFTWSLHNFNIILNHTLYGSWYSSLKTFAKVQKFLWQFFFSMLK